MKTKSTDQTVPGIKKFMAFISALMLVAPAVSQTVYDDFEGNKLLHYGAKNGVIDTTVKNPAPNDINKSEKCAMYVRNRTQKFDNIKMPLNGKLADVSPFATYLGIPPKIKMKVYTTAPVGTLIEILLGDKSKNNAYPGGTNSQYQAHTTVSGAWEELEFKFAQIPEGSETPTDGVNQVTLLFNPNSASSDTYYFDDITGPAVVSDKQQQAPPEKPQDKNKKNK
ncbi:MAG: hypothetical protein JWO44_288 [Bacteroidetes bacterium]|nr:hypothetical protein [Bacteroidota bacterium]